MYFQLTIGVLLICTAVFALRRFRSWRPPQPQNGFAQEQDRLSLAELQHELAHQKAARASAEQALNREQGLLAGIMKHDNSALIAVDQTGRIIFYNEGAATIFGYSSAEATGSNVDILEASQCSPPASAVLQLRQLLAGDPRAGSTFEAMIRCKDGSEVSVGGSVSLCSIDGQRILWLVAHDITQQRKNEDRLRQSLREKDVLIREIHHRVKNNLQIIYSLLNLQSRHTADDAALFVLKESQNRIKSIALIYETLYNADALERIEFLPYAQNLVSSITRSFKSAQRVNVESEPQLSLRLDSCVPCGLIINELVGNSLKHGFVNGRSGEIRVGLKTCSDGSFCLHVSDNGVGFPPDLNFSESRTLGLRLVMNLTSQLNGTIDFNNDHGAAVKVTFREV